MVSEHFVGTFSWFITFHGGCLVQHCWVLRSYSSNKACSLHSKRWSSVNDQLKMDQTRKLVPLCYWKKAKLLSILQVSIPQVICLVWHHRRHPISCPWGQAMGCLLRWHAPFDCYILESNNCGVMRLHCICSWHVNSIPPISVFIRAHHCCSLVNES